MSITEYEMAVVFTMIYGGVLSGLFYDVCRLLRQVSGSVLRALLDVVFVLIGAIVFSIALFCATGGAFRPYAAASFFAGFILNELTLRHMIQGIFTFFVRICARKPSKKGRLSR